MLRDIILSFVGHILVFAGMLIAPMIGNRTVPQAKIVTVTAVTPQSISGLLARNTIVEEPRPNVPQVQVEKDNLIPQPEKKTRKAQPVKRVASETADKTAPGDKGDARAKGKGLPEGIQTDQYVDSEYLVTISRIIRSNWRFPNLNNSNVTAIVFFEIGRDGKILRGIRVEKRSGYMVFDKSTYDAIISSAPFPRLPDNFSGDRLGIHLSFSY